MRATMWLTFPETRSCLFPFTQGVLTFVTHTLGYRPLLSRKSLQNFTHSARACAANLAKGRSDSLGVGGMLAARRTAGSRNVRFWTTP
eukprot:m.184955 g.184955  ORF g.184955 m.184955 type:complete len:88 (+) comp16275_c0_seq1:2549-2812(+)